MKHIFACLFGLLLCACTSTEVHLYARYLPDEQRDAIRDTLEEAGFAVSANTLRFPDDITHSTILHSPIMQDPQALDRVLGLLSQLQWSVQTVRPLRAQNHWFTQNSLGVYLLGPGVRPTEQVLRQDLVTTFSGDNCAPAARMTLKQGGRFHLSFQDEGRLPVEGQWRMRQAPYLELNRDAGPEDYFEVRRERRQDQMGDYTLLRLLPLNVATDIEKCDLVFGLRD